MYIEKEDKTEQKVLKNLILKQNQGAYLKSFWD